MFVSCTIVDFSFSANQAKHLCAFHIMVSTQQSLKKRSKYPSLKPILAKFAEENKVPGGYRESGEFEILYMNWDLYRRVAESDAIPGAPYSRGNGQLGAIDMGTSPGAGGVGLGKFM
jgi:hypothetical protein